MNSLSNTLFWIGLLVSALAFLASQSQRVQSLLPIVAPSYADAAFAKARLLKSGVLRTGDRGFEILSERFLASIVPVIPPDAFRQVHVVEFKRVANSIRIPGQGSDDEVGIAIDVVLLNGQSLPWSSTLLERQIAPLKDRGIVVYSSIIFVIGICIQVLGRLLKPSEKRKSDEAPNKAPEPTPGAVTPRANEGVSK